MSIKGSGSGVSTLRERAVITGLGAVTPLGNDVPTFWAGLVAGRSGVGSIAAYDAADQPVRIAAEIKDFDASSLLGRKQARRTDPFTQVALIAADQAVADAGINFKDNGINLNAAVVLGTAIGGITTLLEGADALRDR
jgi:3-oxoacyl-[acyl-carrier-protein] synthase II